MEINFRGRLEHFANHSLPNIPSDIEPTKRIQRLTQDTGKAIILGAHNNPRQILFISRRP